MICLKKRLHAIVSGRVQGVGYRYFVLHFAEQLHLTGFTCNTPEEKVEVVAEGEEQALKEFLEKLKQGPGSARVENLHVDWLETKNEFPGFEIVH